MHPGNALIHLADGRHIAEIKMRVYAVAVHIHGQRDGVHIAGALTVSEKAALDALGTGQHGQLSIRHTAAAVIVRMWDKMTLSRYFRCLEHHSIWLA